MVARIKQADGSYCYSGPNCRKHGGFISSKTADDEVLREEFLKDAEAKLRESCYLLAKSVVPRDRDDSWADYYAATDAKHFGDRTLPGSKFTSPSLRKFEDVVALAAYQRGNLDGDDRDKFVVLGASADAFQDGARYLLVKTPGTVGVVNSAGMEDDVEVQVMRTKPGIPCSLVWEVDEQPTADYAVVVMVSDSESGKPMAITGFPGVVTKSLESEGIDALEGQTIPLGVARRLTEGSLWLNTKMKAK